MPEGESDSEDQEPGETESAASRWWLTNDILAGVLVVAASLLVLLDSLGYTEAPTEVRVVFVFAVGVAVVWAFGSKAASTFAEKWG